MLNLLRKIFPERSKTRLLYHKMSAIIAALAFFMPANKLKVIAVTGTSGKSTTVDLIHHIIQKSGKKCGAISTVRFMFGDETEDNVSLRTSLRPWQTQKLLRRMAHEKCEYVVLEVSSHAIDQNRIWGINIDTAVLTNIYDNEHLDYHGTFEDYIKTKARIFKELNFAPRKLNIPKSMVLNRDDEHFDYFNEFPCDKQWTFSRKKRSDFQAKNAKFTTHYTEFDIDIPNASAHIKVPVVGAHNLENILAAMAVAMNIGIPLPDIAVTLENFTGVPGRLETINMGQDFAVIVDFSYKPSALQAVLSTLKEIADGRIIVVWGGTVNRAKKNLYECGKMLDLHADEIVLTTDDPGHDDPKVIAKTVKDAIKRKEGDNLFDIGDRYEAIRYAIFVAQPGDVVLVAGRGHEKVQQIGSKSIQFDDREVCREILSFVGTGGGGGAQSFVMPK